MISFRDEDNKAFFQYWQQIKSDRLVPERSSFLPEMIPYLLPHITIYEMESKDCIKIRLSGTAINERDGHNRTGRNYLDYIAPERREKASEALWIASDHPCAMRVLLRYESQKGSFKESESIGVPIVDTQNGVKFLYFCSKEINLTKKQLSHPEDSLEVISVDGRDFLNIGAGIPKFKD